MSHSGYARQHEFGYQQGKTAKNIQQIVDKMCSAISCGVCRSRVSRATAVLDPSSGRYHFAAECHGDSESCLVDVAQLFAIPTVVVKAEAFKPKAEKRGGGRYA